ncbi:hypothetical protein GEV33_006835 [Tenebrio molitor]|uniref:Uncharacterized protein n=1 Tax=Tenebrio molitor TaxID=7067 RepID=A0A8J6HKD8_TENMO|nr:hypothetical protein GEV33_006835 [Tenebrio molitor]
MEREGILFDTGVKLDSEPELTRCRQILVEIHTLFTTVLDETILRTAATKLVHLKGRLGRLTAEPRAQIEVKARLCADLDRAIAGFKSRAKLFNETHTEPSVFPGIVSTPRVKPVYGPGPSQSNYNWTQVIGNWGIAFQGDRKGDLSVFDFLVEVDEKCASHDLPKDDLLRHSKMLFKSEALVLLRTPSTEQTEGQSVEMFLARFEQLEGYLLRPLPFTEKMSAIQKNILLYYQDREHLRIFRSVKWKSKQTSAMIVHLSIESPRVVPPEMVIFDASYFRTSERLIAKRNKGKTNFSRTRSATAERAAVAHVATKRIWLSERNPRSARSFCGDGPRCPSHGFGRTVSSPGDHWVIESSGHRETVSKSYRLITLFNRKVHHSNIIMMLDMKKENVVTILMEKTRRELVSQDNRDKSGKKVCVTAVVRINPGTLVVYNALERIKGGHQTERAPDFYRKRYFGIRANNHAILWRAGFTVSSITTGTRDAVFSPRSTWTHHPAIIQVHLDTSPSPDIDPSRTLLRASTELSICDPAPETQRSPVGTIQIS